MNRQNNDLKIFIASVVINLLILFLIPGFKIDEIVDKKLKVGLVSLETNTKKITTKPEPKKQVTPVKEEKKEEKQIVKKEEVKPIEQKQMPKETKKLSLDDLAKSISKRETEFLAIDKPSVREIDSDLKNELLNKKELQEAEKKNLVNPVKDITISKDDIVLDKTIDSQLADNTKNLPFQGEEEEELGFKTMVEKNGVDGLPSGYRLGVEDGDVVAKWDQANREPRYPEAAQLRGMQGKVLLKIQIDETGKVASVFIEKGSGVPEINMAIEEIARTWKIYLTKNGLNIKGNVNLEYSFKLLGTS